MTDYFKEARIREFTQARNQWVIHVREKCMYLHFNGEWRDSAYDEHGALSAVYINYDSAKAVFDKYKPQPVIGQIKPGEKFCLVDTFGTEQIVYTCIEPREVDKFQFADEFVYFVDMVTWKFGRTTKRDCSRITYV